MERNAVNDRLFESILKLRDLDDCYTYFEDLCTMKELADMAQRLQVAEMLSRGVSYQKIGELTGVSSATIGRVNRCLCYGSGGYRAIIERLSADGGEVRE